jgi:two-component system, OmpR family, sensor histidine kinase SenX3
MQSPRTSVPITLTVALVTITAVLWVTWQITVARGLATIPGELSALQWLLVGVGALFFAMIVSWMILQAVWLVREIRSNQRQRTFIDAVTHELHTPLASLKLYLDTLRSQDLAHERQQEFLEIMGQDLHRLHDTIDQILSAARSDTRRKWRALVDLRPILTECIEDARARHGFSENAVVLSTPDGASVRADPTQLRVVFRNLLENAVRYAGEKLRVAITVRPYSARKISIEFADDGVGIAAFELTELFQRFQRFPKDGLRTRGLGLGLYIVRNIVRAHGGSVHAYSDGTGAGSRFLVTLPGAIDEAAHPAR